MMMMLRFVVNMEGEGGQNVSLTAEVHETTITSGGDGPGRCCFRFSLLLCVSFFFSSLRSSTRSRCLKFDAATVNSDGTSLAIMSMPSQQKRKLCTDEELDEAHLIAEQRERLKVEVVYPI